jgi:putative ABC transport system ATP-binding protein
VNQRPIVAIQGLEQRLRDRERPEEFVVRVEHDISLYAGDFAALVGPSGCGKTTLLSVLGLLRAPTSPDRLGHYVMNVGGSQAQQHEVDVKDAWVRGRRHVIEGVRRSHIGFALQSGELLPSLTVRENIEAPLRLNGWSAQKSRDRADALIGAFRLRREKQDEGQKTHRIYDLANARINRLSGGEYQRVALARAIGHHPQLVFVDEPTAALNRELARDALQQFRGLLQGGATPSAAVMITHDESLAKEFANVVIRMEPLSDEPGGQVVEVVRVSDECKNARSCMEASP